MVCRDGSFLNEGTVLIFCDMCICRRHSQNFGGETIPKVAILGASLFVLGLGLGPLVAGPVSEIYGRNVVYHVLSNLFIICMFPLRLHLMYVCVYVMLLVV